MSKFIIRPIRQEEIKEVSALWLEFMHYLHEVNPDYYLDPNQKAFANYLQQHLTSSEHMVLVAQLDDQVIGFLMARVEQQSWFDGSKMGFIRFLVVREQYQSQGIGRAMVDQVLGWFESLLVKRIELYVLKGLPASGFWDRMGFEILMDRRFFEF